MYLYTYTCKLQTIAVHLKTISFVGHKLYFNLYGTFPIKSMTSSLSLKWIKKFIKVVLTQERILGFRATLMKGFDALQMLTTVHCFKYIK